MQIAIIHTSTGIEVLLLPLKNCFSCVYGFVSVSRDFIINFWWAESVLFRPVKSQFGARGNYGHSRGPCRLPHPRGIAGPLRHCGARGSLPPLSLSTSLVLYLISHDNCRSV